MFLESMTPKNTETRYEKHRLRRKAETYALKHDLYGWNTRKLFKLEYISMSKIVYRPRNQTDVSTTAEKHGFYLKCQSRNFKRCYKETNTI